MKQKNIRVGSYVNRGNKRIADGKIPEAMKLIEKGLKYYSEKVVNAISPYAKADAGLIVLILRHIADEVERNNLGAKELYEGMKECVNMPLLTEVEKTEKVSSKENY